MQISNRPGYVYVMANLSLPGWHKVGHTHRPPHRRALELSKTSVPTAFEVAFARFFWDAPVAEKTIHFHLSQKGTGVSRRKEFFDLPLLRAREIVEQLSDVGRPAEKHGANPEDLLWEETLDGRETLWEWAETDWSSEDPERRRQGWRSMEALSAQGWAEGSWRLADHIYRLNPGPAGAERAVWVLDAARVQGMAEAGFRAAWLRSFRGNAEFFQWQNALAALPGRWGPTVSHWPARILETLSIEKGLWSTCPARRLEGAWVIGLEQDGRWRHAVR